MASLRLAQARETNSLNSASRKVTPLSSSFKKSLSKKRARMLSRSSRLLVQPPKPHQLPLLPPRLREVLRERQRLPQSQLAKLPRLPRRPKVLLQRVLKR